jgi:hypothetical protein
MVMLADTFDTVIGGDTHTDTHTAYLLERLGREVAARSTRSTTEASSPCRRWCRCG